MLRHMHLMRTPMLRLFTPSHLHLLWQKPLMNGQLRAERTFSGKLFRLRRCSLRQELQVQYTVLWQPVH